MKLRLILRLTFTIVAVSCAMSGGVSQAFACSCGLGFHGKNDWEIAKKEAEGTEVIFEGTPERLEMQWGPLSAREGDLISTSAGDFSDMEFPRMVITFRVSRAYKADLGPEVQISTGLGGGDCGAIFSPGLSYLVFAQRRTNLALIVSMCSPGGWIGNGSVAVELRFLRNERPAPSDLRIHNRWPEKELAEQEKERARSFDEQAKRYSAATGSICGNVVVKDRKGEEFGLLSFLSTKGFSPTPFAHPTADIRAGGAFCSGRLAPGKYVLNFLRFSSGELVSSTYYPGVDDRKDASEIEINSGSDLSGFIFKVPAQKTYSVRGFISTNDISGLARKKVSVVLINADGLIIPAPYAKEIDFQSIFPTPSVRYFHFDKVVPGRYLALVVGPGPGWFTKKVDVTVASHMKFISLELVHKN
jgi:hypothetical protein